MAFLSRSKEMRSVLLLEEAGRRTVEFNIHMTFNQDQLGLGGSLRVWIHKRRLSFLLQNLSVFLMFSMGHNLQSAYQITAFVQDV